MSRFASTAPLVVVEKTFFFSRRLFIW